MRWVFILLLVFVGDAWARGFRGGGFRVKGGFFGKSRSSWGGRAYKRKGGAFSRRGKVLQQRRRTFKPQAVRSRERLDYQQRNPQPTSRINPRYARGANWGSWGWGYGAVGVWDLYFLMTVNRMFFYHHWQEPGIQQALYRDRILEQDDLAKLEQRVRSLEEQGVERDPGYLPEGVTPEVAYSKGYLEKQDGGGTWGLGSFLILGMCGVLFYLGFVRRY